jgi:hypothetical protein
VTLCEVCTVHKEMMRAGFLVEPQNQGHWVFGLGLKTDSYDLVIWASKSQRWFLGLDLKTKWATICRCTTKLTGGGWRGTSVEI